MKLLIDGRVLAHMQISGVQRHAEEISMALQAIDSAVDIAIPRYKNRYYQQVWEHTLLPFYARKYDVLYCPSNIAPLYLPRRTKLAITLHDLAFLDFPDQYSYFFQKYYRWLVPKNLRRANYIFTISNYSKDRIVREFQETKNRISVIYHGISPSFAPLKELRSKYVLYVGSMNEIKNFQMLLRLFLSPEFTDVSLKMVLPGFSTFSEKKEIKDLIVKAQAAKNIEIIERVTQNELVSLYQKAQLFVFPSFHESFGFPPLEAMACGVPTIVSNVTALPEVCGKAAIYVDPHNMEDTADKIRLLLTDKDLRDKMVKTGLEHIEQFSWEKTGKAYMKVMAS